MSHFVKCSWNKVEWSILLIHLLPLFEFFIGQEILFGRIVWLVMSREFLLHGCNVDHASICIGSTGPGIIQLVFLPFFIILILIPFYSACEKSIQYFVHLHLFPFRRHEISFGWRVGTDRERIIVLKFDFVLFISNRLWCHFATSYSIDKLKLFIWEPDVSLIKIISDGSPPVFVLGFFDKLGDHVVLFLFGYFLKVFVVTEMFQLVIPSIRYAPYLDLCLLVLFIIWFLLAQRFFCLLGILFLNLRWWLCSGSLHASPIIIIVIWQPLFITSSTSIQIYYHSQTFIDDVIWNSIRQQVNFFDRFFFYSLIDCSITRPDKWILPVIPSINCYVATIVDIPFDRWWLASLDLFKMFDQLILLGQRIE